MARLAMAQGVEAPAAPTKAATRGRRLSLPDRARMHWLGLWVGVPLLITLLSWHPLPLAPQPGLDHSWEAGLQMALHEGVTFGNHLIFTYGPLGFLTVPTLWYSDTGTIAVLYELLVRFALALALFAAARRTFGNIGGALIAFVVADASVVAFETVPFFILGVMVIDQVAERRPRLALLGALGAVAGLEMLNKQSVGLEMAILAVVIALAARGRRRENLLVTLAALIVSLLFFWTITGQDWGALPAYARNAKQIISGYSAGMKYELDRLQRRVALLRGDAWSSRSALRARCR